MESITRNTTSLLQATNSSISHDHVQTQALHLLTATNILLFLLFTIIASTIHSSLTHSAPKLPGTIPWVGPSTIPTKTWSSYLPLYTFVSSLSNLKSWIHTGYTTHSKSRKPTPFILPGFLGSNPDIVMPQSQIRWMLDQPDSVLSTSAAHYDLLNGKHNFVDPAMLGDPYHEHVVHKNMARNLNGLLPAMGEGQPGDIDMVVGRFLGKSKTGADGYTSINLLDFFMTLIPRTVNRIIIGKPACQNEEYLNAVAGFMGDIVRGMLLFPLFPRLTHPFVGQILGLASRYHYWVSSRHSLPIIKQRLIDMRKKEAGDPNYADWTPPNDFITWTVRTATIENRPDELDPSRIAMRIMPLNFAAIHTSAMTGHAAILDILSADPSVLESLREEAARIYTEENHTWTKQGLARMYRLDSALRESQRYSSFAQLFVHRKVIAAEGVTTPDGIFCAPGTMLVAPWHEISQDDDLHGGNAGEFDAFRYSREREKWEAVPLSERDKSETLRLRMLQSGQVTTSDKHLPFGHGRHACPGRFFVSYSQKITFGHLILNYDFKHIEDRPQCSWIGTNFVPPIKARIEIRRRERIWQPSQ